MGVFPVSILVPARQAAGTGINILPGLGYRSLSENFAWVKSSLTVRVMKKMLKMNLI